MVLGARRADRIEALASELTSAGGKAMAVATDVANRGQVKELVDKAVESFGKALQQPVYRLLGGQVRDRVRAYGRHSTALPAS